MKISFPHCTTKEEAVEKLKICTPKLMERFGSEISNLKQNWEGESSDFSFTVYGFNVLGRIKIDTDNVILDAKLPFLAKAFESQISEKIGKVLNEIFDCN
jgi:hypothetical protein